jgi:hypothetical protein
VLLHRLFADRELYANLLVGLACRYQPQHLDFTGGQRG